MILNLLILIFLLLFAIAAFFLVLLSDRKKDLGVIVGDRIYQDTQKSPGKILYSKALPLLGKPDYLYQNGNNITPVEVKTGRTPSSPYMGHIMQLIAYCFLVEENYGVRPQEGIIQYPENRFTIAYTDQYEQALQEVVYEMLDYKDKQKTFNFSTIKSELCFKCKSEI